MSRTSEQINKEAKENLINYISQNDYVNVDAYMGYFSRFNKPEGLNFELNGKSPLAVACDSTKTLDIVKLLLDHDADPNYILNNYSLNSRLEIGSELIPIVSGWIFISILLSSFNSGTGNLINCPSI